MELPVIAGILSTALFTVSALPMVVKAARTKDLSSYSVGSLALINAANGIHSLYVFSLPLGPIWMLHGFYLIASAVMLALFVRYHGPSARRSRTSSKFPLLDSRRWHHGHAAGATVVAVG